MKDSRDWQGKGMGPRNVKGKIPPLPTWMLITDRYKLCSENRKLTRYLRQREQKKDKLERLDEARQKARIEEEERIAVRDLSKKATRTR